MTPTETKGNNNGDLSPGDVPECAVCLQTCIHPVRLPCSHIFCFLCVKGAANQNRRCALCRQDIPVEYFNNPTLVDKKDKDNDAKEVDLDAEMDHYSWFYEGRNGWWQYDERTNVELEESYNAKKRSFELLIAGYMYVIDLDNMLQMRRHDQSRRRRIKRDLVSAPKKGIAGLKIAAHQDRSGTTQDQQIAEPEEGDTAAGGEVEPPQRNGVDQKSVPGGGSGETKRRTAGVGRDAFSNVNQSNVDQYDADDDCDESDDDENNVQWLGSHHGPTSQRSRPSERRGRTELYARVTRNNGTDTEANAPPSGRQNPQGLPVRHQRVSSAPETNSGGHNTQPVTRRRRAPPVSRRADPPQERVDSTSVDSAIQSLHVSTPDEAAYEVSTVPVQPPRRELRQRRHRHRQNEDVAL